VQRSRKRALAAVVAVAGAALAADAAFVGGTQSGEAARSAQSATTRVAVTAGKPSEFRYRLSRRTVFTGTVVFRVTNRGKIRHDFRIRGKKTAKLRTGKSGTLRVRFAKPGTYRFVCTLPGHAAAGMKGTLRVKKAPARVTVTAGKPSEFRYRLSRRIVPKGAVSFTVINRGKVRHDFRVLGRKTKSLAAGKRQKLTVTFRRAGKYRYVCTLPGHAAAGMRGTLTVR
jgi:uncharacterized cupredoxin-like copper-binding protein